MPARSINDLLVPALSLAPTARTASANGTGVDLLGYEAAEILIVAGIITDGSHAITIEESANNSDFTAVAAADRIGSLPTLTSSSGGSAVHRFAYVGGKRYIRVVATASGTTSGGIIGALVLRGRAHEMP